jgi:hypothetical protein
MKAIAFLLLLCLRCLDPASFAAAAEGAGPGDLPARAQAFVGLLAAGRFAEASDGFDEAMRAAMPPDKLRAAWKSIGGLAGAYEKQLSVRTETLGGHRAVYVTCQFQNGPLDVRVVFDEGGRIAGLWFGPGALPVEYKPPAYADPGSFTEKELVVGSGQWALPGTLTIPRGDGPFPAVVLVHGSGPHDRDETVAANKPFKDLAWGLASRGIAVLRYEKRTKVHGEQFIAAPSVTVKEETIDDAVAAVSLLRKTDVVDARRVFVLGHSLGGMLIPRIGRLDPALAGLIIMAGTARPLEDVVAEQVEYVTSLDGTISVEEQSQLDLVRQQVGKVKDPALSAIPGEAGSILGAPASYWLDLRAYDPPEAAKQLEQPVLILQGGRDYQVTMKDYAAWQQALASRPNVEFKVYPRLNHLFVEGEGRSTPAEYEKPGHVAEGVIADVARWVAEH